MTAHSSAKSPGEPFASPNPVSSYYTFVSSDGDTASWTSTHKSYRATQASKSAQTPGSPKTPQNEPIFVEAHIIDERDTPFGHKTTWANTGNNPSAGFHTSWTSSERVKSSAAEAVSGGRVAGVAQTVAGIGLMAIGVPMLIFPGPGIAVIAGGAALAGSGLKKVFRGK